MHNGKAEENFTTRSGLGGGRAGMARMGPQRGMEVTDASIAPEVRVAHES